MKEPKAPRTIKEILSDLEKHLPSDPERAKEPKKAAGRLRFGGGRGGGRKKTAKSDTDIKEMVGADKYPVKPTPAAQMKIRAKNAAYMRQYRAKKRGA